MRDAAEVGRMVARRRLELSMDAAELSRRAGVDPKTVASLEHGERWPRDRSRAAIEAALGWQAGSLDDLRAGRDATPSVETDPLGGYSVEFLLDYVKRRVASDLPLAARTEDEPKPNA